jgi:hypothetical protein
MYAVYSPEDFPKMTEDGMADYRQAFGIQVVMKAHTWTELKGQDGEGMGWKTEYFNNWIDASGDAKEVFISCKDWATRVVGDFRERGLRFANLDKIDAKEKKAIEADAEAANLAFRRRFVQRFEISFRERLQGNPGRLTPNDYERECYDILKMEPPEIVQRAQPAQTQQVVVQPDPAMIQDMVRLELEKQLGASPKGA